MNEIYIVSGRSGAEMEEPQIFKTEKEAEDFIKNKIYDLIIEDHISELEEAGVNTSDVTEVLNWGQAEDMCTSYNSEFPDTYTDSEEWSEFMITKVDLSKVA